MTLITKILKKQVNKMTKKRINNYEDFSIIVKFYLRLIIDLNILFQLKLQMCLEKEFK